MEENSKKTISRTIQRKTFDGDVEIIIPFHGAHAHVSKIIQTLFNTIYSNKYLVTLVDDGSKNSNYYNQIQGANIPGLRILRKEKNTGFGSAINFALSNPFKFSKSEKIIPYIVVVHSDVLFSSKDWLFNLGSCLEKMKHDGVKMVSPLTNNPVEDMKRLISKNKNPNEEDFVLSEEEFLPMYCSLFHRDLIKYVSFPESNPSESSEARELASSMRSKGFFQAVCGKSWVYHEGRVTTKKFDKKRSSSKNIAKDQ